MVALFILGYVFLLIKSHSHVLICVSSHFVSSRYVFFIKIWCVVMVIAFNEAVGEIQSTELTAGGRCRDPIYLFAFALLRPMQSLL